MLAVTSPALGQSLVVDSSNSPLVLATPANYASVSVVDGGVLIANAGLTVIGDMIVETGGLVTVDGVVTHVLSLSVGGTLEIEAGGSVDVSAKGLAAKKTIAPESGAVVQHEGQCGGAHVTQGTCWPVASAPSFDSPLDPRHPGGGGSSYTGGGVIVVKASALTLNGRLAADGEHRRAESGLSGAGGTVRVAARQISGSGLVSANGGVTSHKDLFSAGGLVWLHTGTFDFVGDVSVESGTASREDWVSPYRGTALLAQGANGRRLTILAGQLTVPFATALEALSLRPGTLAVLSSRASVATSVDVPA